MLPSPHPSLRADRLPTATRQRHPQDLLGLYRGRHRVAAPPLLRVRSVLALLAVVTAMALGPAAWSPATAITWFNTLCKSFAGCNAVGLGNAGYQNVYTQSFFGMYGGHNCTNYAAYRLKARGVDASYLAGQGNGYQWGPVAASHGVKVDKNPQVGDIAWFDQKAGLSSNGHVAYVEVVDTATGRVKLSEDNWGGDFDWRWYYVADVTGFIHFGGAVSPTPTPPPPPMPDGTFLRVAETGQVFRLAGGAPLYVGSWTGFGGQQPTTTITAAQLDALPAYPADGTFLQATDGRVFRVAGGAPMYVSTWASFGGQQSAVVVDGATIDRAGGTGLFGRLLSRPRTGTFLRNAATNQTYVVAMGAPILVPSWAAYGGMQPFTVVDPWELASYAHLSALPGDGFLRAMPSNRVIHVVSGRPLVMTSWAPFGGMQPTQVVDDAAVAACDHLRCDPFGNLDSVTGVPGGAALTGWADEADAAGAVSVAIEADGARVAVTPTGTSRPDVDAVYHHGTNRGFSGVVQLGPGSHQVCARAVGTGAGAASTLLGCGTVMVTSGSTVAVTPTRLLDTRSGNGAPVGAVAPGTAITLAVGGRGPVPTTGASAVLLNVTATGAPASGYVTAYPAGTARPLASNVSFPAGGTVPGLVLVPLGAGGAVTLYNGSAGPVQLVADVAAYVVAGAPSAVGTVTALAPTRILDTRSGLGADAPGPIEANGTRVLRVAGVAGVPATGAASVVLSLTTTAATSSGYVTAYAGGTTRPTTSNVQFDPWRNVTNTAIVPVGADGTIELTTFSPGSVHVVVDVTGWVASSGPSLAPGAATVLSTTRIVDTRSGIGGAASPVAAGGTLTVPVLGRAGIPASGVSAVLATITATRGAGPGYLTAYPAGSARPLSSAVNYGPGANVPNLVVVPLGAGGAVSITNTSPGRVDVVVDIVGWVRG